MQTATLIQPHHGYYAIYLIEKIFNKWLCQICDSGEQLYLFEDEFILID